MKAFGNALRYENPLELILILSLAHLNECSSLSIYYIWLRRREVSPDEQEMRGKAVENTEMSLSGPLPSPNSVWHTTKTITITIMIFSQNFPSFAVKRELGFVLDGFFLGKLFIFMILAQCFTCIRIVLRFLETPFERVYHILWNINL